MFVSRTGGVVKIRVDLQIGTKKPVYQFAIDCGENEEYAELIRRRAEELIQSAIGRAVKSAYENGYRDGRNHRAKFVRTSERPWSFE